MFRCDDHQKEQRAGPNPPKPLTDGNMAFESSLPGASEYRASPRCEPSHMDGGEDATGKRLGCPDTLVQEIIWSITEIAAL